MELPEVSNKPLPKWWGLFYNEGEDKKTNEKERLREMTNRPIGNEAQMAEIRKAMALAKEINLGDQGTSGPIEFHYTSRTTGKTYEGTFVFKRPNMRDFMRMGVRKAQRLAPEDGTTIQLHLIDPVVRIYAEAISELEVVTKKAPEWLIDENGKINYEMLDDPDLVMGIADKYHEWMDSFRHPTDGDDDTENRTTSGPTEAMATSEDIRG